MCYSDKKNFQKQLNELKKKINEQRKISGLRPVTNHYVLAELVDGFLGGLAGFLCNVYFSGSQLKEIQENALDIK